MCAVQMRRKDEGSDGSLKPGRRLKRARSSLMFAQSTRASRKKAEFPTDQPETFALGEESSFEMMRPGKMKPVG